MQVMRTRNIVLGFWRREKYSKWEEEEKLQGGVAFEP